MISGKNILENMKELVKVPSISGTMQENLGALKLYELIEQIAYFKKNKENLYLVPVKNDYLKRNVVVAEVKAKKKTNKTIIVTGHYDVVGIEEYGHLKDVAFDVDKITERISELTIDDEAKRDLGSGNWLFGRGGADMKYGDALCIELLRYFSEEEECKSNILFLGVPGEETNSEGMLEAVKLLSEMQEKGVEFIGLINTEAYTPKKGNADDERHIHVGSSGKVMPLFLCCGTGTHAGEEPFGGFDSALMCSKLHEFMHHNCELCDEARGVVSSPPVCLKITDLKTTYNVTTPIYTAAYYNMITVNLNIDVLIPKLKAIAEKAFTETVKLEKLRADKYANLANVEVNVMQPKPKVMMFNELYSIVSESYGGDFDKHMDQFINSLMLDGEEIQTISVRVFKEVVDNYYDKSPMIVIGFIPPYYPDNYPSLEEESVRNLFDAVEYICGYAKEKYNEIVTTKDFYMGLSDMCYTGLNPQYDYNKLFENILGIDKYYNFPYEELKKLNIPAIVFGPYAKDAHKSTERLDKNYNFNILPELLAEFIRKLSSY